MNASMLRNAVAALAVFALVGGCAGPMKAGAVSEPSSPAAPFDEAGYRNARYRAPVDHDAAPARAVSLDRALAMAPGAQALFLDVMPAEGGVRDAQTGSWQFSEVHQTIPGAQWHPETGRAPVDPVLWQALEAAVRQARKDRPHLPVVVFCRSDCWMSWNAARRLAVSGFGDVLWLAEGTDGWHAAGRVLEPAVPVTVPGRQP